MQYVLQHAADFIYRFIRKDTANCSDSNNLFYPEKQKYLKKKKKIKENSLYFLSQYENHRFNIAYIYCIHHLNIQSSTGGVTVKSNVIYLLFTLCVLVQRSKLCTVKHCVA